MQELVAGQGQTWEENSATSHLRDPHPPSRGWGWCPSNLHGWWRSRRAPGAVARALLPSHCCKTSTAKSAVCFFVGAAVVGPLSAISGSLHPKGSAWIHSILLTELSIKADFPFLLFMEESTKRGLQGCPLWAAERQEGGMQSPRQDLMGATGTHHPPPSPKALY